MKTIYDTDEEYKNRLDFEQKHEPHEYGVKEEETRYTLMNKGIWVDSQGKRYKIEEMKTSHIRNCLSIIEWNYIDNKGYVDKFEQELKKRGEFIPMTSARAERLLEPLYQELREEEGEGLSSDTMWAFAWMLKDLRSKNAAKGYEYYTQRKFYKEHQRRRRKVV